jgi:predicted nucleic acid-binding protein
VIFIDTGVFIARYAKADQHHAKAIAFWNELGVNGTPCVTSSLVLSETFTLLARRTDYRFAAARARQIYSSSLLDILRPDSTDEVAAIQLFEKYSEQRVSFCDCASFVVMRRFGIQDAFTFDHDFAIAGFSIRP